MSLRTELRTANVTIGTVFPLPALPNGAPAQGIKIDNPSGNWIEINTLPVQRCPPFTMDWSRDLPNVTSLSAKYINSPSGPVSAGAAMPTGVQVIFTVSSEPVGDSEGVPFGVTAESGAPVILIAWIQPSAIEAGAGGTLVGNVAGRKITVVSLSMVIFGIDPYAVRDQILCSVGYGGIPPPNIIGYLGISPQQPSDRIDFFPAKTEVPVSTDLVYELTSATGSGTQNVALGARYYLQ